MKIDMAPEFSVLGPSHSNNPYNTAQNLCEAEAEENIPSTQQRDYYFCVMPEKNRVNSPSRMEPPLLAKILGMFNPYSCTSDENQNQDGGGLVTDAGRHHDAGGSHDVVGETGSCACVTRVGGENLCCDGDIDRDGIMNQDDRCPLDKGPVDTGGCPVSHPPVQSADAGTTVHAAVDAGHPVQDGGASDAGVLDGGRSVNARNSDGGHSDGGGAGATNIPYVIERVDIGSDGLDTNDDSYSAVINSTGRFVAFSSDASNLVENDTNGFTDIFLRDREMHTTERISVGPGGVEANGDSNSGSGFCVKLMHISGDGRFVVFESVATNLVSQENLSSAPNIYLYDHETRTIALVIGGSMPTATGISEDGQFVAYTSYDFDHGGRAGVFVYNRLTGDGQRVDVDPMGTPPNWDSFQGALSGDGQKVAFMSTAFGLPWMSGNNPNSNVFFRDLTTNAIDLISSNFNHVGTATGSSDCPVISGSGDVVAFHSNAPDILEGVSGGLFVYDRRSGDVETILGSDGVPLWGLIQASISGDGRYIAYGDPYHESAAIYVRDRIRRTTKVVSVWPDGVNSDYASFGPDISSDGHFLTFVSSSYGSGSNIFVVGLDYFFQQ